MIKKFFAKLLLFILLISTIQIFIASPVELPHELIKLQEALKFGVNIIYFGDSTVIFSPKNDLTNQSTPEILWRLLPNANLWAVVHNAYDMEIYADYADYIVRKGYRPKFLVIPINLRDFSPVWNLNPNAQFKSDEYIIKYTDSPWIKFYHPLGVFKSYEPFASKYTWEHTKITFNNKSYGIIKDLYDHMNDRTNEDEKFKKAFILNYMYNLKPSHPRIQSMLQLVKRLKNTGIEPVFYITPIDVQSAEHLIGDDFIQRLTSNISVIKSVLADQSLDVLDLSAAVPAICFAWREEGYPTEHMNYLGRLIVAKSLAEKTDLKIIK